MKKRILSLGTFGLITWLAACGGDSGSGSAKGSATAADASTSKGKLACAKDVCQAPADMPDAELCCMDPFKGGCGVKIGGNCRNAPNMDMRCPVPNLLSAMAPPGVGQITVFGCCTTQNECGLDFGMGCQARSFLCQYLTKDQLAGLTLQTCDGTPMPLPDNCGQNGTGFLPGAAGSGS